MVSLAVGSQRLRSRSSLGASYDRRCAAGNADLQADGRSRVLPVPAWHLCRDRPAKAYASLAESKAGDNPVFALEQNKNIVDSAVMGR